MDPAKSWPPGMGHPSRHFSFVPPFRSEKRKIKKKQEKKQKLNVTTYRWNNNEYAKK